MPYATQDDLLQRVPMKTLIQLTDDAGAGVVDAGVIAGALETASGNVDSYCRARYQTPLAQSDMVTNCAADIAVYRLFTRRPGQISETVRQRYEDAMSFLKDIANSKASLDQPVGAPAPQTPTAGPVLPTCSKLRMTDCDLKGFV